MKISLKIDFDGEPYIELLSENSIIESEEERTLSDLLELFVRKARNNGIEIKNESDMETRSDYASIRIKQKED